MEPLWCVCVCDGKEGKLLSGAIGHDQWMLWGVRLQQMWMAVKERAGEWIGVVTYTPSWMSLRLVCQIARAIYSYKFSLDSIHSRTDDTNHRDVIYVPTLVILWPHSACRPLASDIIVNITVMHSRSYYF